MAYKAARTEAARSGVINIRISAADRNVIDRAAKREARHRGIAQVISA